MAISYGEHKILNKINFSLEPEDAIGILGINGAGKSTFMKTLAGILTAKAGNVFFNKGLKIGYFAQHQIDQLDMQASPLRICRDLIQMYVSSKSVLSLVALVFQGYGFSSDN